LFIGGEFRTADKVEPVGRLAAYQTLKSIYQVGPAN
jgi:hypothetical protein